LGEAGEGKNVTPPAEDINAEDVARSSFALGFRWAIEEIAKSAVLQSGGKTASGSFYGGARTRSWEDYVPQGTERAVASRAGTRNSVKEFWKASEGREVSTTIGGRGHAAQDAEGSEEIGSLVVPM